MKAELNKIDNGSYITSAIGLHPSIGDMATPLRLPRLGLTMPFK